MTAKEVRSLLQKAERSVRSAQRLLDDGDADFAVSRAYYAMFHAAAAALLCRGVTRSKHSGVIAAFGETLVKAGDFASEHHAALREAFDARSEADYSDVWPSRPDVEQRIAAAHRFVEAVREFVDRQLADTPPAAGAPEL